MWRRVRRYGHRVGTWWRDLWSSPCGDRARGSSTRVVMVRTADDAVACVSALAADGACADVLLARAVSMWTAAGPSEADMRTLSLLQQSCAGSGDAREYATVLLWLAAQQSILEA